MPSPLIDNFGRRMDYLRIAVTDRCNLRCRYCMPENGIQLVPRKDILSWEELERISRLFIDLGIQKIRVTGGEPFVRKGLTGFIHQLRELSDSLTIGITTNGTLIEPHLKELQNANIRHLNFSLDSLEPDTFNRITRRDEFKSTLHSIETAYSMGFRIKVNMVALPGMNLSEIPEFAAMTEEKDIEVRFIEPMPFDGNGSTCDNEFTGDNIKKIISERFPLVPVDSRDNAVATLFRIPGFAGRIGIIYGASRTFCDTCSRLRLSARGELRTCLYGHTVLDLKALLRENATDEMIMNNIREAVNHRYENGFEAEKARKNVQFDSMATIGG